jgi:type III pantothenate kinase
MSILLVDIGNTRAKWALFARGKVGRQHAVAHEGWTGAHLARHVIGKSSGKAKPIERVVVVSVAGKKIDRSFALEARRVLGLEPEFFSSKRQVAGVTTMYAEPWRLGADRLVGVIGAHHLASKAGTKPRAVCVISVGTAMTMDLVDERGRHRGGAIVPAPALMMNSLLTQTSGIRRRAQGGVAAGRGLFARSTRAAIQQGAMYAAAAVADRAVAEAHSALGQSPWVLLTGGAAPALRKLLRSPHEHVPDLVLQGLAVIASDGHHGS